MVNREHVIGFLVRGPAALPSRAARAAARAVAPAPASD
jgi:hypothetical protein